VGYALHFLFVNVITFNKNAFVFQLAHIESLEEVSSISVLCDFIYQYQSPERVFDLLTMGTLRQAQCPKESIGNRN
jgi:hypothetical protein